MMPSDDAVAAAKHFKRFWKEDPVHMTSSEYKELAKLVLETMLETTLTRSVEKKEEKSAGRGWVDWAERRSVHRNYSADRRGREVRGRGWTPRSRGSWKRG
jgi:hypothetical protein